MFILKETAIINDGDFSITFHDKKGNTITKPTTKLVFMKLNLFVLSL